jgi:tight adherence protein C
MQIYLSVLTGLAVVCLGGSLLLWRLLKRTPLEQRLRDLESNGDRSSKSTSKGEKSRGVRLVESVGAAASAGRTSPALRERLTQAGFHSADAATTFIGAKIGLMVIGLLGLLVLVLPTSLSANLKMLCIGGGAAMFFFIPNLLLARWQARRRGQIRRYLPDAVDLLEICASAGMGLDIAWNSVAEEVRGVSSELADEMALTDLEIHLGATRADAMRHMAQRTGADELSSLVAVLVQSERFGTSVAEALRVFATAMREDRTHRAQEAAEKLAVKLILPMVVFIFPALILVMVGPAGLTIARIFGKQ